MEHWKKGDICFFIESNSSVIEARITAVHGDMCTIKYADNGAIRLRSGRLYPTAQQAQAAITQMQPDIPPRRANPYLYNH